MRAATLIILALAAAAPAVGQKYHHSCDYISKSDSSGVPDKLKFKCKRTGGKSDDCTELTLADCIGVDILYGSLEGRNSLNEHELFPYPHGCQGCKWDSEETSLRCQCTNKDDKLAYLSTVHLDTRLSNYDGTIVGRVPQCRSKRVDC
ncbi:hypothetical protein VUR80DRAFT_8831 [Thermomyces stellatus]